MSKRRNETEDEHTSLDAKRTKIGSPSEPTVFNHADFTIGWICALPKEQTAAIAMLDQEHPDLPPPDNDDNVYTLGSIGGHNVVITCLPKGRYGTNSAATIATKMIGSFPSIKFGLLVGIGGGIPSKVRLGDVVVSAPTDQYPGVVQWDLGKAEDGGRFRRTGALNSPPNALLKVLSKLESDHERQGSKIPNFLDEMKEKWPKLYPKYFWNASLRDPQDTGSEGAANTTTDGAINEPQTRCPGIHHGLIASGNQVIKDATVRDRLDGDLDGNVLCIEMEAAGLMNDFPCLVVRGICDYADSGKNKDWQEYAAAVAAAFTKEILFVLQAKAVERMDSVKDTLSNINSKLGIIQTACKKFLSRQDAKDHRAFLNWLTTADYTLQQRDYFSKRHPGTGQWLLCSDIYRDWVDTSQQALFCPGIPGAGKTILTSIIINDLFGKFGKNAMVGIAYIYCNFRRHDDQKLHDLLISLLKQLALGRNSLPQDAKEIFDAYKAKKQRPSIDDTKRLLQHMAASYSRVFILIDALDECQGSDGCREIFLNEMFHLQENTKANFFATSRFIPEIEKKFETCKRIEIRASGKDVQRYLNDQLEGGNMEHLPSLTKDKLPLKDEIIRGISDAVDGMFLLAKIYLESLDDKISIDDVKKAVAQLPKQMAGSGEAQRLKVLNDAYESAWQRITRQKEGFRDIATRVLAWIVCAKRPLSTKELQHALAVKVGIEELDKDAIPQVHDMVSFCAGLVTIDEKSNVIRLVHYTTQEYFETKKSYWFPNAEAMIAEICISYLSFKTFGEYCPDWSSLEDLRSQDFYKYASYYWGDHARIAGRKLDKNVLEFLMSGAKASNACYVVLQRFPPHGHYTSLLKHASKLPPMSGLHLAVHFVLDEAINLLLKKGCDVHRTHRAVMTPLLLAISKGHLGIAETLLDNGAYPGSVRGDGEIFCRDDMTPLSVAMLPKNYNEGFVKRLIASVIDIEEDISTCLPLATKFGHEAIVKLLLDKGANTEATDYRSSTLLHICQNEAIAKLLLNKNANIEARNNSGSTPLHLCQNEAITELLLDKGADTEAKDNYGSTPLFKAIFKKKDAIIKLLLNKSANINAIDQNGNTPLHICRDEAIVELLLNKGANIEVINNNGYTPLLSAIIRKQEAIIKLLLNKGANINAIDQNGNTPLHLCRNETVVKALLNKGANIEVTNNSGYTPLLLAIIENEDAVAKLLLHKGANINVTDQNGDTLLLIATKNNREAIVKLLLDRGVSINVEDQNGDTPLDIAGRLRGAAIFHLLRERAPTLRS